ncbi:MAG: methyltransferase domain-containing protein [Elusimicrobia bacterium]|nr:methyltransferase domain-containing protein [Elusimicrobiota bacterium]MBK7208650.1 methyltransferase domain-containing protein [Elusimicrobiota bacterium]MBK7545393.1 methyltransferase domain-containing protein [Elusimicrobiota bacterium]MBK7575590.1 methyltransferase domain-containing protein [Elusimicrobiota bacterium]MBK7688500.1 methyltransferase domain-containing protein [Elusimicrobiota bacterium]
MIPLLPVLWSEKRTTARPLRVPEPRETMDGEAQVAAYLKGYEWGGSTSAMTQHHLERLSALIRPNDTVVDLGCGPGPLLWELARLYPSARFLAVDRSAPLLDQIKKKARELHLKNVHTVEEDPREMPGLRAGSVGLVLSTQALHHAASEADLRRVFCRINDLLAPEGGVYFFDFGLLKSAVTRRLLVQDLARWAPPLTLRDYALSLDAAFPISTVVSLAREEIHRPFEAVASAFVDFFYFLSTPPRAAPDAAVVARLRQKERALPWRLRWELALIRRLRRHIP